MSTIAENSLAASQKRVPSTAYADWEALQSL